MNPFFASFVTLTRLLRRFALLVTAVFLCGTIPLLHAEFPPPLPTLRLNLPANSPAFSLHWEDPSASGSNPGTNFVLETTLMTLIPAYWTPLQPVSQSLVVPAESSPVAFFRLKWSPYWRSQMDSDGDGINDWVEEQNPQFLAPDRASDAVEDWDRDGVSNRNEVLAGTDPDDFPGQLAATDGTGWGIKREGRLWGWGANPAGRLGDGTVQPVNTPRPVAGGHPWRFIAAGLWHSLAVDREGHLWAWGFNDAGQVGDGSTNEHSVPTPIGDAQAWVDLAAGDHHSLAVASDGSLWVWGSNTQQQLGLSGMNQSLVPVQLPASHGWKRVFAGGDSSFALSDDGRLWAWGANDQGQLGLSDRLPHPLPTLLAMARGWQSLSVDRQHTLAVREDGSLWEWGSNRAGQVADDSVTLNVTQIDTASDW